MLSPPPSCRRRQRPPRPPDAVELPVTSPTRRLAALHMVTMDHVLHFEMRSCLVFRATGASSFDLVGVVDFSRRGHSAGPLLTNVQARSCETFNPALPGGSSLPKCRSASCVSQGRPSVLLSHQPSQAPEAAAVCGLLTPSLASWPALLASVRSPSSRRQGGEALICVSVAGRRLVLGRC